MKGNIPNSLISENMVLLSKELLELIESSINLGTTQKELASVIGIQASTLSHLKRSILPKIVRNEFKTYNDLEEEIRDSRCMKATIYKRFNEFIDKVKSFKTTHHFSTLSGLDDKSIYMKLMNGLSFQIEKSAKILIERGYEGLYDIYNLTSTDNKRISKQPMMIKKSEFDTSIEVFVANKQSHYHFEGIAMVLGSHCLYITLVDSCTMTEEVANIQFTIPYFRQPSFLRGCLLAIDTVRQPFATRIVAVRKQAVVSKEIYDSIPSSFIDPENPQDETETSIINYLKDEIYSSLRFHPLVAPKYDHNELGKEKQWILERYSKV